MLEDPVIVVFSPCRPFSDVSPPRHGAVLHSTVVITVSTALHCRCHDIHIKMNGPPTCVTYSLAAALVRREG